MMKKTLAKSLAVFLMAAMMAGTAGCGNGSGNTPASENSAQETVQSSTDTASEESVEKPESLPSESSEDASAEENNDNSTEDGTEESTESSTEDGTEESTDNSTEKSEEESSQASWGIPDDEGEVTPEYLAGELLYFCKTYFAGVRYGGDKDVYFTMITDDELPEKDADLETRKAASVKLKIRGAIQYANRPESRYDMELFATDGKGNIFVKGDPDYTEQFPLTFDSTMEALGFGDEELAHEIMKEMTD